MLARLSDDLLGQNMAARRLVWNQRGAKALMDRPNEEARPTVRSAAALNLFFDALFGMPMDRL